MQNKKTRKQKKKKNTKTLNLFHILNIYEKFPSLKSFMTIFDPHKNSSVCSAFNSLWKMESFCWTTNLKQFYGAQLRCAKRRVKARD